MRRRLTASALLAACACAGSAGGQQPAPKKAVDPTDALIQKALANDSDVAVARAKLALAEAELAKARQAAVTRVITLRDTVEQRQTELGLALAELKNLAALRANGVVAPQDVLAVEAKASLAKAALARAETELKLLTGDGPKFAVDAGGGFRIHVPPLGPAGPAGPLPPDQNPDVIRWYIDLLSSTQHAPKASAGPIPDRIRAALDKKVRLGNKGDGIALDAAMEIFKKEAGLDVPIRPTPSPMPRIVLEGEELPIGAWFQMFQDHGGHRDGFAFYVREYGLLVANRQTAPPDAQTLTDFWRTRPLPAAAAPPAPAAGKQPWDGERVEFAHDKVGGGVKAKLGAVVVVTLPVKGADVDDGKLGADGVASAMMGSAGGRAAVLIWGNRTGRATVNWDVTAVDGRRFAGRVNVEFE